MNKPSQEDLLGYVLGAMDAQEARNIERQIDSQPELEDRLLEIKNSLLPLEYLDQGGTRPGLARRTCELIAFAQREDTELHSHNTTNVTPPVSETNATDEAHAVAEPPSLREGRTSQRPGRAIATPSVTSTNADHATPPFATPAFAFSNAGWSRTNMLVTAAALAVMAGLLFPALSYSRYQGRLLACQNNLQQLGQAFLKYSDIHQGQFVAIPTSGRLAVSGCFGPILKDNGLLESDSLLACAGVADDQPVHIPTVNQIESAPPEAVAYYQRKSGGHFGYSMGQNDNGRYRVPRNAGRTNMVLLADAPSTNLLGRRSANHGGRGQNGLFEDGRVQFIAGHAIGGDAIFENDHGIVAPGSHALDSVIAPSHLAPMIIDGIEFIRP